MRISRLYTAQTLTIGSTLVLDDDNAHYVRTVLRLKKLAELILFNGSGGEYRCEVLEVSRQSVRVSIVEWLPRDVESPLQVNLGLGISRGDRMDWSVQKSVELGVARITPIITERCLVQLKDEKKSQRLLHWQRIVQHAAEQSGRAVLPRLNAMEQLVDWVDQQHGLRIFLDPYAEHTLTQLKPETMQVTLLTGPEGGFAEREREYVKEAGFIPVRLGARILRTETASLTALAAVQMLWGDFGSC